MSERANGKLSEVRETGCALPSPAARGRVCVCVRARASECVRGRGWRGNRPPRGEGRSLPLPRCPPPHFPSSSLSLPPFVGLGAHGACPPPRSWRSRWGACWAGDPKAPRPVAAEATAQVGALSPQPGGAGAGVASGRNPGKKGAFCPPGNSVGLGVCLCSHLGFSAPLSRRGKPRQGTWRTGLREAWVWGCQVPPLGLSRDPGKRQFSKLRSSDPPRSAGPGGGGGRQGLGFGWVRGLSHPPSS